MDCSNLCLKITPKSLRLGKPVPKIVPKPVPKLAPKPVPKIIPKIFLKIFSKILYEPVQKNLAWDLGDSFLIFC